MNLPTLGDLETINIRPTAKTDLPQLVKWMNDPSIQETLVSKKRQFTVKGQEWQLAKMHEEKPRLVIYNIFLADRIIGRLKLTKINLQEGSAHVSILLAPEGDIRGKGYGTAALKLLVDLARTLKLKKLTSKIQKENTPSIIIHEKNGFTRTDSDPKSELYSCKL